MKATDAAALVTGSNMVKGGTGTAAAGVVVAETAGSVEAASLGSATGIAAPAAAIGGTMVAAGTVTAAGGAVLMANSLKNSKAGYNYGEKTKETSRAARRESMRDEGIPTSQQPDSQSENASGREYRYGDKSVQQQTKDADHPSHWEAGTVKKDPRTGEVRKNNYGRPKLDNDKSKVYYDH